jgi:hypothetical protein
VPNGTVLGTLTNIHTVPVTDWEAGIVHVIADPAALATILGGPRATSRVLGGTTDAMTALVVVLEAT